MKYHILCEGKLIASFVNESDRDLCLSTLMEAYEDCSFLTRDDKEKARGNEKRKRYSTSNSRC